jgi:peroxiredoxin
VFAAGLPNRANSDLFPVAPEVGALAPPIEIRDLANQPFSLAALHGSPVILNFWAAWCGPCITEMPMLEAAYAAYRRDGLRLIAVDAGEPVQTVLDWKAANHLTFDFLIDQSGAIAADYQVRGYPTTYFISRSGTITHITNGPLTQSELDAAIRSLLAP